MRSAPLGIREGDRRNRARRHPGSRLDGFDLNQRSVLADAQTTARSTLQAQAIDRGGDPSVGRTRSPFAAEAGITRKNL